MLYNLGSLLEGKGSIDSLSSFGDHAIRNVLQLVMDLILLHPDPLIVVHNVLLCGFCGKLNSHQNVFDGFQTDQGFTNGVYGGLILRLVKQFVLREPICDLHVEISPR